MKDDLEEVKKRRYLFVAGGVGSAPVYPQVKWLKERGIDVDVVEGAKTKDMLILEEEMRSVAGNLYITTDDGSYVRKGMVTDVVKDLVENQGKKYDVCVAIGPMIMMKFVCRLTKELGIPTIVSMNPIMVDGTGMCGACRVSVGGEVKFACVDGPEFDGHLVDFDQAMKRQQMYKTEEAGPSYGCVRGLPITADAETAEVRNNGRIKEDTRKNRTQRKGQRISRKYVWDITRKRHRKKLPAALTVRMPNVSRDARLPSTFQSSLQK